MPYRYSVLVFQPGIGSLVDASGLTLEEATRLRDHHTRHAAIPGSVAEIRDAGTLVKRWRLRPHIAVGGAMAWVEEMPD